MPNLSISIDGLALFRLGDDSQWKIYFPYATDHPFKLTIINTNKPNKNVTTYTFPVSTQISFFPNNNQRDAIGSKGNDLEELEAKGLAQFHKDYFREENIPIKKDLSKFAGILNLNGTSLQNQKKNYEDDVIVWVVEEEKDSDGKLVKSTKTRRKDIKLGNKLYAEYDVNDGNAKIEIRNDSVNFDIDLDFSDDNSYDLFFKNDCEVLKVEGSDTQILGKGCMETSDFKHYYDILETPNRIELSVEPKEEKRPNLVCSPTGG